MKSVRPLVAHLMRRAGFGATPAELDTLTRDKTYEEIVDDLIHPERFTAIDTSLVDRYYGGELVAIHVGKWLYRMVNTQRPLEEKMALFLHHIFPVAWGKSEHGPSIYRQVDMFRNVAMTDVRTILLELSRDPAMIFWLDNNENHRNEINENYGRELLELFSMGVGNYTEDDIKSASRAFTGWTFRQPLSLYPVGHYPAEFEFIPEDHDDAPKTFLGETGNFNGDDIIDIIVRQPAAARFISRHLYNFFIEDEVQVPSWATVPARNEAAIEHLSGVFLDTGGDMRAILGALFQRRLFQECNRPAQGEKPDGAGGGRAEADRRVQVSHTGTARVRGHDPERLAARGNDGDHGPAVAQPAHRGGLAHRARVDRLRHLERTGRIRRTAVRRPLQAGHPGNRGARRSAGGRVR